MVKWKTGQTSKTYSRLHASAIAPYLTYSLNQNPSNWITFYFPIRWNINDLLLYTLIIHHIDFISFHLLPFHRYFWSSETSFFLCVYAQKWFVTRKKKMQIILKSLFFYVHDLVFFFLLLYVEYCHAIFEFLSHAICTRIWLVCELKCVAKWL